MTVSLPDYIVADPVGNITILVLEPVAVSAQAETARLLLERESKAEQVGYLSEVTEEGFSLRMAGGEFCGNATLSAAAYALSLSSAQEKELTAVVSGAAAPLSVSVRRTEDGFEGALTLPLPEEYSEVVLPCADGPRVFPMIRFPGIVHIMSTKPLPRLEVQNRIPSWCAALNAEALGVMFLSGKTHSMTPLVYVPDADTLYWENSCASGSCATAYYLAKNYVNQTSITVHEPCGTHTVEVLPDRLILHGKVKLK